MFVCICGESEEKTEMRCNQSECLLCGYELWDTTLEGVKNMRDVYSTSLMKYSINAHLMSFLSASAWAENTEATELSAMLRANIVQY